jgi:hypothetical protein
MLGTSESSHIYVITVQSQNKTNLLVNNGIQGNSLLPLPLPPLSIYVNTSEALEGALNDLRGPLVGWSWPALIYSTRTTTNARYKWNQPPLSRSYLHPSLVQPNYWTLLLGLIHSTDTGIRFANEGYKRIKEASGAVQTTISVGDTYEILKSSRSGWSVASILWRIKRLM